MTLDSLLELLNRKLIETKIAPSISQKLGIWHYQTYSQIAQEGLWLLY